MKKLCKRIIAGVFAFVILFFSCMPPVYALALPGNGNVWDLFDVNVVDFLEWWNGSVLNPAYNFVGSLISDDICSGSSSLFGRHNFVERRTTVNGRTGLYYICEYCEKSAGEVAQDAYSDYTNSLPATGYTSAGNLIWQPRISDCSDKSYVYYCESEYKGTYVYLPDLYSYDSIDIFSGENGYEYRCFNAPFLIDFKFYFSPVVSGTYGQIESLYYTYSCVTTLGLSRSGSNNYSSTSFRHYSPSEEIAFYFGTHSVVSDVSKVAYDAYDFYLPVYEIIPDTFYGDTYPVTTRPTVITGGNYGIVGDDGQLTIVTVNDTIVNETNNTYYNPATGNAGTINNWSYDYTDRSYNVTLESGDTVTVTYGDQYITVVENNVTYIIYYIIGDGCPSDDNDGPVNSGSPEDPGTSDHQHSWQETERIDPICTLPGQVNYICENCGQARVDVLSALGHKWRQKQFVPTAYDDDGALIQRGYTIYECSVCGEQYKDETGTGPPAVSDTVDDGGLISFFHTLIKSLSDNLSGAVELILSFFRRIPELFGGFLDFLSAMFPFLPNDIIFLLTFGMAAVVFVGIIKAIRR